jgi:hypothetical protein
LFVIKLVFEPGTIEAGIDRTGPLALADGADMAARGAGRKEEALRSLSGHEHVDAIGDDHA